MSNRLKQEKSPYLLQHGENPVHWYPWCDAAFQRAMKEDKLVFLSIGYSTCHWCHVMAHESFEDEEVAELLNRDFISIKVDREERPDIDAVYMSVCQAMTGSGGWPLTILMTPEQKPFWAGTYLPKNGSYGQYGLIELLEQVVRLWKNDREKLRRTGDRITAAINEQQKFSGQEPDRMLIQKAYAQFLKRFDRQWGGFGPAPKFPAPHNLLFLLRYAQEEDKPVVLTMVESTLDAMARGGIHDHIGGGFSRYSTDDRWLVPHFEKMLYDNALLLLTYLKAYQHMKKADYADVAHRTAGYILRELTGDEGGCFCGQDADSDGIEGKYYVFTPEEVKSVLGEADSGEFCRRYGITASGNFEGKSIPNRIGTVEEGWTRDDPRLMKLYDYRLKRTQLHKDDKALLSWNGWAMMALAKAGQVLGEARYLDGAIQIRRFIRANMRSGQDRLFLRYRDGEAAHAGQLEDYAVYALGLLELYGITFDPEYLQEAIHWAEVMMVLFADKEKGGCFITATDAERLIARPKETYDGAMPSGNSVAAMVWQRLAMLTGERRWREAAGRQLHFLASAVSSYPSTGSFGLLAMMDALYPHRELVCVTGIGIPHELTAWLREHGDDGLSVLVKNEDNARLLAQCAPFTADYPVPEQGTVWYLCENGGCKAPVNDFRQLGL